MSFTVECPFCGKSIEAPDELSGQTAACPFCGQEVYLDEQDAARRRQEDQRARDVQALRAAAIASQVTTMPRVTWTWAFDCVLKITVAVAVIDGALSALIWMTIRLFGRR